MLAAGWLVGSLAALTLAGVFCVTYFDNKGPKGVMEGIDPETNQGQVFPAGLVLMGLAGWQGAECIANETHNSLIKSVLTLQKESQKLTVVANHTWDEQTISLPDADLKSVQVWVLDETTAPSAMQSGILPMQLFTDNTLILKPFAIVGISHPL